MSSGLSTNGFIGKENALAIFKALLDVSIALVAFFGLILVFHLSYINGTKDRVARERYETIVQRDRFSIDYLTRTDGTSSETHSSLQKIYSEIDAKYASRIEELEKESSSLILQIGGTSLAAVITAFFIFASVILNVFYMGIVTNEGTPFMNLFFSLLLLFLTLYSIFTSLIFLQPKAERDILGRELRRMWDEERQKRQK